MKSDTETPKKINEETEDRMKLHRKYLETNKDRLENLLRKNRIVPEIFDKVQDGICICDERGKVIIWNEACEKIYHVPSSEILGKNLKVFFPDAVNLEILKTEKAVKDLRHSPRPGTEIVISAMPIYDDDGILIGCLSTDRSMSDVVELSRKLDEAARTIYLLKKRIDNSSYGNSDFFVGEDEVMVRQIEKAIISAETDVPILILGETGTGKEVFARFIHDNSSLTGKFVPINCSAIPDSLFESEFFGYTKGAFTGADSKGKEGYFEQADSGTLFLDEISEMPLSQQSKLLRVIQEGKVRRLGSDREIPVNVRLISASNIDLEELVAKKEFRMDLYYRIKGISITIPPLRERDKDIEEIIFFFFEKMKEQYHRKIDNISPEAMKILKSHKWRGNMREMENVMRQIVVMTETNTIGVKEIPPEIYLKAVNGSQHESSNGLVSKIENYEINIIRDSLERNSGNISRTAQDLKLPRTTLYSKLKKYGMNNDN